MLHAIYLTMSPALKTKDEYRTAPLCEALGITPQSIILTFLYANQKHDFTLNEIEEHTGIRRHTVSRALPSLLKFNLIVITREIGQAPLYQFNSDSAVAGLFKPFYVYLVDTMKEKEKENGGVEEQSGITI